MLNDRLSSSPSTFGSSSIESIRLTPANPDTVEMRSDCERSSTHLFTQALHQVLRCELSVLYLILFNWKNFHRSDPGGAMSKIWNTTKQLYSFSYLKAGGRPSNLAMTGEVRGLRIVDPWKWKTLGESEGPLGPKSEWSMNLPWHVMLTSLTVTVTCKRFNVQRWLTGLLTDWRAGQGVQTTLAQPTIKLA